MTPPSFPVSHCSPQAGNTPRLSGGTAAVPSAAIQNFFSAHLQGCAAGKPRGRRWHPYPPPTADRAPRTYTRAWRRRGAQFAGCHSLLVSQGCHDPICGWRLGAPQTPATDTDRLPRGPGLTRRPGLKLAGIPRETAPAFPWAQTWHSLAWQRRLGWRLITGLRSTRLPGGYPGVQLLTSRPRRDALI